MAWSKWLWPPRWAEGSLKPPLGGDSDVKGLINLATLMAQHVIAEVRVLKPFLELDGQKGRVEAWVRT